MENITVTMGNLHLLSVQLIVAIVCCLHCCCAGEIYDACNREGVYIRDKEEGIIRSENYPSMYPSNRFCKWNIQVKPSQSIIITMLDVDLDDTQARDHCVEYLSIFNPHSMENHATECGRVEGEKKVNVDNNTVEIWFHSSPNHTRVMRGFALEFKVVGCDNIDSIEDSTLKREGNVTYVTCKNGEVNEIFCIGTTWHPTPHPIICKDLPIHSDCQSEPVNIVDLEGYIHSPNFPKAYPPDKLCVWRLGDQTRRRLRITILKLSLTPTDYSNECRDYLGIYELTRGDPVTDIHCQNLKDHFSVVVESGLVDILFESRERPSDKTPGDGFLIKYEAIGCAKAQPPGGSVLSTDGNETVIRCMDGREFKLECIKRQWSPPVSSISCYSVSDSTEASITQSRHSTPSITRADNLSSPFVTSTAETRTNYIPFEDENDTGDGSASSFPLLPVIIGVVAVFLILLIVILIFIICRRKRRTQARQNQEEDTVKIYTEPDNHDCETEPRSETGNGLTETSNGHLVTQVHYVRPNKGRSKKNKDSLKGKRTSYHLTVADDEAAIIENESNNCVPNDT